MSWIRFKHVYPNRGWGKWHRTDDGLLGGVFCGSRDHSEHCRAIARRETAASQTTDAIPPLKDICYPCSLSLKLRPKSTHRRKVSKATLRNLQFLSRHRAMLRKWVFLAETVLDHKKLPY